MENVIRLYVYRGYDDYSRRVKPFIVTIIEFPADTKADVLAEFSAWIDSVYSASDYWFKVRYEQHVFDTEIGLD